MSILRKPSHTRGTEVSLDRLRPGHIIGDHGDRVIVSSGTDHGDYQSFVVRYPNGELRIESWESGTTVPVVGRDVGVAPRRRWLRLVPTHHDTGGHP